MIHFTSRRRCPHVLPQPGVFVHYNREHRMRNPFLRARSVFLFALTILTGLMCGVAFPPLAIASTDFLVSPVLIDAKAKQRDILKYTISIQNTGTGLVSLYPWVTDVDAGDTSPRVSDLAGSKDKALKDSLARWIQITRGTIDILPGDTREVPLMIEVNLSAPPGVYHAVVHFSHGNDRPSAEANTSGTKEVMVNVEVLDDARVRLQLGTFASDKTFFESDSASFNYRIENIGNRGVVPTGMIRIFDRSGEEVGTVPVNAEGEKIEPNARAELASVWMAGGKLGRYKALLDVSYGDRGTLQDSVFFWVLPIGQLIMYFLSFTILIIAISLFLHSYLANRRRVVYAESRPQRRPIPHEEAVTHWNNDVEPLGYGERLLGLATSFFRSGEDDEEAPISPGEEQQAEHTVFPSRTVRTHHSAHREARHHVHRSRPHVHGHAPITLSHKPKPPVDPAHIVTLPRR